MIKDIVKRAQQDIQSIHHEIEQISEQNQERVLQAFKRHRISDNHFSSTTGYGYDDLGRDTLEDVYADIFGGEDALVRPQIVSGTHAISTTLFGLLRPDDELVYITGKPYDTLDGVVGKYDSPLYSGSLKDFGIHFKEVMLLENGSVDYESVKAAITERTKVIGIQRSRGYDNRPSYTIAEIAKMIDFVKQIKQDVIVFVDNCYGEFVEDKEPLHVGADVIAGSLIKNPGGGLVRAGGYIIGKKELIHQCGNRLTAPGLGKEMGATFNMLQEMYQGLFLAPHIVSQALKGAVFTSRFLELLGFSPSPAYNEKRTDLIQSVNFDNAEQMIQFCQTIQANSPVNAYVVPHPAEMPGYEDDVIMAAGTFIQGSSIELSADGPVREPYTVFVQGGLTYEHVKIAMVSAAEELIEKGFITFK